MKRVLALVGLGALLTIGLLAGLVASDVAANGGPPPKVFVCKYVGTPGPDERLQTGDNPINVSASSIKEWNGENPGNLIGLEFADAQGFSRVIAIDEGQPEPTCSGLPPLIEVTPTAPSFQDPTCEVGAAVNLPTVTGVTYTVSGTVAPGHEVRVRATANEGYVLTGQHEWEHTFGNVPENCTVPTEVTPTAPTFRDPTCDLGAAVNLPTVEGVTYAVTGAVAAGHTVTVNATAEEGYDLVGTDEWTHTFGDVPDNCTPPPGPATEVTPGVTFQDPTCDVGAAVIPTTTTGLTYTIDGKVAPGEKVTVTASANDGYTIRGNNRWEHTFGQVPSNCATPPTPTDVCPNIEGVQQAVPDGLVLDAQGNCVEEETETTTTAPFTPPVTKPAAKKPAVKTAPKTAKKAVAGAFAQEQPKLAYTP